MDYFAKHLKALRNFKALTRKTFAEKHGIPVITLSSWELGKSQISDKQLDKLITAFEQEGLFCSKEWLLRGQGPSPFDRFHPKRESPLKARDQERQTFLTYTPEAKIISIPDDTLRPFLKPGDLVGGVPIDLRTTPPLKELLCFMTLKGSASYHIRLVSTIENDLYALPLNRLLLDTTGRPNPPIETLYQIIWIRYDA